MWYYPITDLFIIIDARDRLLKAITVDNSSYYIELVACCNKFIKAYAHTEEEDKKCHGEYSIMLKLCYDLLKYEGIWLS